MPTGAKDIVDAAFHSNSESFVPVLVVCNRCKRFEHGGSSRRKGFATQEGWPFAAPALIRADYCSSDSTIEDMLLVCLSIVVPACSSIWLEVTFDNSVAKSTSIRPPVAT